MGSRNRRLAWAVGLIVSFTVGSALAKDPGATDTAEREAAQLVTRALEAGIAGDQEKRDSLLQDALRLSPDFAPAHWQLGHVHRNGKWQRADKAAAELAADATYAEYQKLQKACGESALGQLRLARWCQKHGLPEEERLHWGGVLFHDFNNQEAIKALGLRKYRNRWMTQEQIDRVKQFEADIAKARDYWKPRLERWAEAIDRDLGERDKALAHLRAIADVAAIPWLETFVSPRSAELGKEVVAVLGQMERQEATDSLVRHALASDHEEIRAAAATALKERPLMAFVGPLVESLTSPPEVQTWTLFQSALGPKTELANFYNQHTTVYVERLGVTEQFDDYVSLGAAKTTTISARDRSVSVGQHGLDPDLMKQGLGRQRALVTQAATLETRNIRICELLQAITGQEFGRDQTAWWKWWADYNELHVPQEKPALQYFSQVAYQRANNATVHVGCCFTGATLVHTKTGLRAIADIKPGEFVLAQHVESGEPAYRIVLLTTVRPAQKLLQLEIGGERLECMPGHPFWVVGEGWKMAKELRGGDQLQRLGGAETVSSIREIEKETSAYNLIVADCNNYFVGTPAILAHDNTGRRPTSSLVPGLSAED